MIAERVRAVAAFMLAPTDIGSRVARGMEKGERAEGFERGSRVNRARGETRYRDVL